MLLDLQTVKLCVVFTEMPTHPRANRQAYHKFVQFEQAPNICIHQLVETRLITRRLVFGASSFELDRGTVLRSWYAQTLSTRNELFESVTTIDYRGDYSVFNL